MKKDWIQLSKDWYGEMMWNESSILYWLGGEAFAITCPLITKADGTKFGKDHTGICKGSKRKAWKSRERYYESYRKEAS